MNQQMKRQQQVNAATEAAPVESVGDEAVGLRARGADATRAQGAIGNILARMNADPGLRDAVKEVPSDVLRRFVEGICTDGRHRIGALNLVDFNESDRFVGGLSQWSEAEKAAFTQYGLLEKVVPSFDPEAPFYEIEKDLGNRVWLFASREWNQLPLEGEAVDAPETVAELTTLMRSNGPKAFWDAVDKGLMRIGRTRAEVEPDYAISHREMVIRDWCPKGLDQKAADAYVMDALMNRGLWDYRFQCWEPSQEGWSTVAISAGVPGHDLWGSGEDVRMMTEALALLSERNPHGTPCPWKENFAGDACELGTIEGKQAFVKAVLKSVEARVLEFVDEGALPEKWDGQELGAMAAQVLGEMVGQPKMNHLRAALFKDYMERQLGL